MAIKKTIEYEGITITDAEHSITMINTINNGDKIIAFVSTETRAKSDKNPIIRSPKEISFEYDLQSNKNLYEQAYDELAKLDKYKNGVKL